MEPSARKNIERLKRCDKLPGLMENKPFPVRTSTTRTLGSSSPLSTARDGRLIATGTVGILKPLPLHHYRQKIQPA